MNLPNLHLLNKAPWAVTFNSDEPLVVSPYLRQSSSRDFHLLVCIIPSQPWVMLWRPSQDPVTPLHFSTARACSAPQHWSWCDNSEKTSCTNKMSPQFQGWWLCTSILSNGEKEILGFDQKSPLMQPQDAFLLQGYNCCWHPLTLAFFPCLWEHIYCM